MKNYYYSIISSGLVGAKSTDPNSYKTTTYFIASLSGLFILYALNSWLNTFGICDMMNIVVFDVISKKSLLSGQLHGLFNYGILSMMINWPIIYFRNNYKTILKMHPQKNGNLMMYYFLFSLFLPFLTVVITRWLREKGIGCELSYMKPLWVIKLF